MTVHNHCCLFVPPYVLDNLARSGIESARLSVQPSIVNRRTRSVQLLSMVVPVELRPTGTESRKVYNCEHHMRLRSKLVRGEDEPASTDDVVNQAYDGLGNVRTYYKKELSRSSIDDRGLDMLANIHYGENFLNAFWNGSEMVFGDGDNVTFVNFARSIGVVGHELTHGVIDHTAQLVYDSQPGALNEHFADVFGCVIEQYARGQTARDADWLIGDEIMGPNFHGQALRSMKAPGTAYDDPLMGKDPQPAHMRDYYTGSDDDHGVHINSGIPNKAFYLVAMSIGTDKAALIWYAGLQKLWATAQFTDAAQALVQVASDLIKAGQVPAGSEQSVQLAFKEVGVL
jgi:Zn-dependent metalloprotease